MNYCLGFIFNKGLDRVLLIKKLKGPKINALNGIGGKIENDEAGSDAMERECREETGLIISDWKSFASLSGENFKVYVYYAVTDDVFNFKQLESEEPKIYDIDKGRSPKSIPNYFTYYPRLNNIDWLIPMALNHHLKLDNAQYFEIQEK